jgi:hypothetical protein
VERTVLSCVTVATRSDGTPDFYKFYSDRTVRRLLIASRSIDALVYISVRPSFMNPENEKTQNQQQFKGYRCSMTAKVRVPAHVLVS